MNPFLKAMSVATLLSCSLAAVIAAQTGENAKGGFELRLAESKPAEGLTEAVVVGTKNKVYLHKETLLSSKDVAQAKVVALGDKQAVEVSFNEKASKTLAQITEKHTGKPLAMVVDGKVIFAPMVRAKITDGKAQITGSFSKEDAERIAKALRGN